MKNQIVRRYAFVGNDKKEAIVICKNPFNALLNNKNDLEKRFRMFECNKSDVQNKNKYFPRENIISTKIIPREVRVKLALYMATKCLPNFEKEFAEDKRPANAIKAAQDCLDSKLTQDELGHSISEARAARDDAGLKSNKSIQAKSAILASWGVLSAVLSVRLAKDSNISLFSAQESLGLSLESLYSVENRELVITEVRRKIIIDAGRKLTELIEESIQN